MNNCVDYFTNKTSNDCYEQLLELLNKQKVIQLVSVIVYMAIMIVVGTIGNSIVCVVYFKRMRAKPSNWFILVLASMDLLSCTVGMAFETVDIVQPYTFSAEWACKCLRFVLSFTSISSCLTLLIVAFDRYYKICKPLRQFSPVTVKRLCTCAIVVGLAMSWPTILIFGTKTVDTPVAGIVGTECSTSNKMIYTTYPVVFQGVLLTAFFVTFTAFLSLYIRIGFELRKRKKMAKQDRPKGVGFDKSENRNLTDNTSDANCLSSQRPAQKMGKSSMSKLKVTIVNMLHITNDTAEYKRRRTSSLANIRTARTTIIFMSVSIAFVLSFLPFLIINILKFRKIAFHEMHSTEQEIVYNILVRSFCLNSVVNPIIYSVLNRNFRRHCFSIFFKCSNNGNAT